MKAHFSGDWIDRAAHREVDNQAQIKRAMYARGEVFGLTGSVWHRWCASSSGLLRPVCRCRNVTDGGLSPAQWLILCLVNGRHEILDGWCDVCMNKYMVDSLHPKNRRVDEAFKTLLTLDYPMQRQTKDLFIKFGSDGQNVRACYMPVTDTWKISILNVHAHWETPQLRHEEASHDEVAQRFDAIIRDLDKDVREWLEQREIDALRQKDREQT